MTTKKKKKKNAKLAWLAGGTEVRITPPSATSNVLFFLFISNGAGEVIGCRCIEAGFERETLI